MPSAAGPAQLQVAAPARIVRTAVRIRIRMGESRRARIWSLSQTPSIPSDATAKEYQTAGEAQLLNVLKATGIKVGLLINFGRAKLEFKWSVL